MCLNISQKMMMLLLPCIGALFPQDDGEHGMKILLKMMESIEAHLGSALQQQGTKH